MTDDRDRPVRLAFDDVKGRVVGDDYGIRAERVRPLFNRLDLPRRRTGNRR